LSICATNEKEALENIKEAITAWMWAEDQKAVHSMPDPANSPSCGNRFPC
jgi:hypothetical protein